MGEGLSKVNKLNVTFDNPSLFPFHAFRENKRIYNYFFNKYVFSQHTYTFLFLKAMKYPEIYYLSSKKKNLLLLYSHVTYLYLINYTYSP